MVIVDDFGDKMPLESDEEDEIDFAQLSVEIDQRTRVEKSDAPVEEANPPEDRGIEEFKEKLPEDFSIENVANLNLREAEKIASEDVHLFAERDLEEELEELTLDRDNAHPSMKDESIVEEFHTQEDVDYVIRVGTTSSPGEHEKLTEDEGMPVDAQAVASPLVGHDEHDIGFVRHGTLLVSAMERPVTLYR